MSNKASDSLHRLIKSLTKPEKRYFKVYSSRHVIGEKNNYQVLFDAIDRQDEYDEEKLLKKFEKEAFIKRFSIAKNRLYQSVLKSLDAYHSNSSIEAQLKRQIHSAEILYRKSLYGQSLKILRSAEKVAVKNEKITSIIEIRRWKKRIIEKENYEGHDKESIIQVLEDDQRYIKRLEIHDNLWSIKSRVVHALYRSGGVRSDDERKKFKKIIDDIVVQNTEPDMLTENQYLHNHIYAAYHYGMGEYKESYDFTRKNLDLIVERKHLFAEEPGMYLSSLTNAINLSTRLKQFDEVHSLLDELQNAAGQLDISESEDLGLSIFSISESTKLALYTQQGEYEKGLALIPQIEEMMIKYDNKISSIRKAQFYFNIAVLHFWQGNANEALKWINQLLNNIGIDYTTDIHCMAQLFNLVIHIELDNRMLLPYALRSTKRYLETRNKVFGFEEVFLNFTNELLKKRQEYGKSELFEKLANDLKPLAEDDFERNVFDYFDFLKWANSKVEA